MSTVARALFLVLLPQAGEADRLVRQLRHDDIIVRERAAERLVELGAKARPALMKARAEARDVQKRISSLLSEINLGAARGEILGPPARVTLPPGDHTLSQIAEMVKVQTGVELRVPQSEKNGVVKVKATRAPFWEFLDRLCKAHGELCVPFKQPADAVELQVGKEDERPVFTTGPFRFWIERLRLERHDSFDQKWGRGILVVGLAWTPMVRPTPQGIFKAGGDIRIKEIRSSDKNPLKLDPRLVTIFGSFAPGVGEPTRYRKHFFFELPAKKARKLARISGSAYFNFTVQGKSFGKYVEFEFKDVDLP